MAIIQKRLPKVPRSEVPAIFLLQVLEDGRRNEDAEILSQLLRREITRPQAFCRMHPVLTLFSSVAVACTLLLLMSF